MNVSKFTYLVIKYMIAQFTATIWYFITELISNETP